MSDPFSIASGVVGIVSLGLEVVKGLYEYCSTLKDQSSDIARIRDSLFRLHDLLGNLRRQLDARRFHSNNINILACIEGRILECKECVEKLKKAADKFNHSQDNGFRAALKAKVRRATYPFQQNTLQKLEGNVDKICQHVLFSLQLLQNEDTSSIRNNVEDTKDLLESHRAKDVAQNIINWLNAPDATTNFIIAREKSQPGTGSWLIDDWRFNAWFEQEKSFLWLYGFAGCGKSILCSTAIQHILQYQKSTQDKNSSQINGVAFFFFAFDDTGKQDVFRWVDCQLREIAVCPRTEEHLDKLLTSLPRTLDDTYERMLLAIPPASQDYAEQILMLLCCAKRNLTIEELIYGMAVDLDPVGSKSDDTDAKDAESDHVGSDSLFLDSLHPVAVFKDKRRLHDADAVLEVCPGFIELYEGRDANREETLYVRLAHFSVQEYLKSDRIKERENVAQYQMREQDMNTKATWICLAILEKFSAAVQANDSYTSIWSCEPDTKIMYMYPWACYAAIFWPDHFRESKQIPPEAVSAMLRFRPHAVQFSAYLGGRGFFGDNLLQFAIHYGLSSVVSVILQDPTTDINEITGGTTALFVAAKAHDMELVRCLLDRDADVNGYDGGALTAAARTGQVDMAKLFLDHGAEINASAGEALDAAAEVGDIEMARFLLENGAEINVSGSEALHIAAWGGGLEMAKLLLDHGVEINAGGSEALASAAWGGHFEMAKLLLESGAEIDASGSEALHMAAWRGHLEMAKLLLEGGADANLTEESRNQTALWSAVGSKELEFVRLLLEYGAEVNHRDDSGQTVLHKAAAQIGYEDGVQFLLEHGAKVNIADSHTGRTALHEAAESGNEKIARLLLEAGADPNVVDKFGNTVLSLAAKRGCQDLVTFVSDL
ncbi:hypothetical protein GCG54_00000939 [Colletotrichum gloeosporioides]|uniref:Fungal N-terminal domain-containing protein n=1 Tax=Colletotrichum gloeosporioides TaxID=474922 RepID=A0A8H4C9K4_COLGL|nr:uncharacterized protein GCG54_00000939 [Colletotrichum gloeosporioides]KAF3799694.1 hypothetical protein GCG54_00000939 [Colletotrichum gloeosporioides]